MSQPCPELCWLRARRMRSAVTLVLLAGFAWAWIPARALDPGKPLRQYGQQQWQTDDGLPQNTVHAIRQTRDGYLWLATDGGLVRFDGVDFTLFDKRSTPVLRSNLIGALTETDDGVLWAATADGLLRRSQGTLRLFTAADGLPAGSIAEALPAGASHLWAVTPEGIFYGSPVENGGERFAAVQDVGQLITARDGTPVLAANNDGSLWLATARSVVLLREGRVATTLPVHTDLLAAGEDGILWLATAHGLLRYRSGNLEPVAASGSIDLPIRAITVMHDGVVAVATARGLGLIQSNTLAWKSTADGLPTGRVLRLYPDRHDALWVVTEDTVARYSGGRFDTLHPRSGTLSVEDLYEDLEGSLWLGTDADGLLQLREQRFTTLSPADGLPADVIRALLSVPDGSVWAGTDGGGLAHLRGSASQRFTTQQGLGSNTILSLAQQGDGSLAVGTPDGLNRLTGDRATPYARADVLPDDLIRSLLYDPSDRSLWIGTRRGLAHQLGPDVKTWTRSDGLGSDLVGALELDTQHPGALWIGTRGGLSHLQSGRITNLTMRDGLSSDVITALYQDASGSLWIGTNGGGLCLLRNGYVTAFGPGTGLPEVIHSIVEDGRGNLWLGSATGIYRVARALLDQFAAHTLTRLDVAAYGVADGMRINECSSGHPAAVRTPNGELWFATLRGISVTDPEHAQENRLAPPVVVENATVDDQPAAIDGRLNVGAGSTRVSIHYAGLSYVAPGRVRYRYRLQGFDPAWVEAGTRRIAYYTNIPPGHYTFQVLAANNDGVWNETGATLQIRVLPHVYQTWWFRTLLALAVCLIGYQLYRMRVRSVELRFDAVLAERTRIAREIHDTLAQDIVGISVQLELVSRLLSSSVDAARTQLDTARTLVKSSLTEARSSIWNLRSATAVADDLPARMAKAINQIAAVGPARVALQVKGTYRAAPRTIEDELLRVAQEAVSNAVRHAAATHIGVTLHYDTRAVELAIADDGHGFRPDPAAFAQGGHFGLKGMQERADQIHGILRVESAPGKGTRISLHVEIP